MDIRQFNSESDVESINFACDLVVSNEKLSFLIPSPTTLLQSAPPAYLNNNLHNYK